MIKAIYTAIFCVLLFIGCTDKKTNQSQLNSDSQKTLKDTVYVKINSSIVSELIYLYIDSLKFGDTFTDKEQQYGYYRLLFTTSEETQAIYAEKINIVGDGLVKLGKRINVTSALPDETGYIKTIHWKTPEIISIESDNELLLFNLTTSKIVRKN